MQQGLFGRANVGQQTCVHSFTQDIKTNPVDIVGQDLAHKQSHSYDQKHKQVSSIDHVNDSI
jgi:hypothetical protein